MGRGPGSGTPAPYTLRRRDDAAADDETPRTRRALAHQREMGKRLVRLSKPEDAGGWAELLEHRA